MNIMQEPTEKQPLRCITCINHALWEERWRPDCLA